MWHPTCAAFSTEGVLSLGFEDHAILFWDTSVGGPGEYEAAKSSVVAVAFREDGKLLDGVLADGTTNEWAIPSGVLTVIESKTIGRITLAVFDGTGHRRVLVSDDLVADVTMLPTELVVPPLRGHNGPIVAAGFSRDGRRVMTAGDTTVRIWDTRAFADPAIILPTSDVRSLSYDPAGQRVLTAGFSSAQLWDAKTGKELKAIGSYKQLGELQAARFDGDGGRIVTAARSAHIVVDGKEINSSAVHVWNAATGAEIKSLRDHRVDATDARFLGDGPRLLTVSDGIRTSFRWDSDTVGKVSSADDRDVGLTRIWDASTGALAVTLGGAVSSDLAPAVSADGRRLVVVYGSDHDLHLVDATSGKSIAPLKGHSAKITSAIFNPDGARIATTDQQGVAILWDGVTGELLARFDRFEPACQTSAFSPDSKTIAIAAGASCAPFRRRDAHSRQSAARTRTGNQGAGLQPRWCAVWSPALATSWQPCGMWPRASRLRTTAGMPERSLRSPIDLTELNWRRHPTTARRGSGPWN